MGSPRDSEWASRLGTEQSDLALGFQHVRNLVHHRWWEALSTQISVQAEGQRNVWVWTHLSAETTGQGKNAAGNAAYANALANHPVLETLDGLAAIFWDKRTWQITKADVSQPGHEVGSPLRFDVDVDVDVDSG